MATFTLRHELQCDAERFWELFFDLDFNERLFKALQFPQWKLIETRETDSSIIRNVKATPKMDVPAAVAKLLGSSFGYDEVSTFDKASKTLTFVIKTNILTEKLRNDGTVTIEPRGEGKCLRVVEITAEAKVFGVGKLMESAFEKSFRSGWQKSADLINAWVGEGEGVKEMKE